jgi:hypothetical protein
VRNVGLKLADGGNAMLRIEDDGEIWFEKLLDDGWVAAFRILPSPDASPLVAEVRVFPGRTFAGRAAGEWWGSSPGSIRPRTPVPKGGLTTRKVREARPPGAELFTRELMREYVEGWRALGYDADAILFEPLGLSATAPEPEPQLIGRPRVPDIDLADFAALVLEKQRSGSRSPVKDAADEWHMQVDTARKWLSKAEDRGILTGRFQGRSVGRLTDLGQRLADQASRERGE